MTETEELKFLAMVQSYVAADPKRLSKLVMTATQAIVDNAQQSREHAVDMETVAAIAINTRLFKGQHSFLADKIEKWYNRNALKWDAQIAKLRSLK